MIVKVIDSVSDYKQAIKITCDELVKCDSIDESYYNGILEVVDQYGPYFCIADQVAMPHARPDKGVKKTDLCILKLNQSVDFLGKEIKVFFTISSQDSNSHLEMMKMIAQVCMDEVKLNKILNSNNENEIMEVM